MRADNSSLLFRNGTGASRVEYPRGSNINTVAELMINSEVNAMSAVIFIWKPLTVVYASFRKLTVAF